MVEDGVVVEDELEGEDVLQLPRADLGKRRVRASTPRRRGAPTGPKAGGVVVARRQTTRAGSRQLRYHEDAIGMHAALFPTMVLIVLEPPWYVNTSTIHIC